MQNTMLIILLVSATLMTGHQSEPCPGPYNHHTEIHNNTCYLISFEAAAFKESYKFCRSLGGYLTDMEENRSSFFKSLAANNNLYNKTFWIGLLWASSLDAPVWDSGRTYTGKNRDSFFDIGDCAMYTPRTATWEWVYCSNEVNFICSLESLAVASNNLDPCVQVCSKIKTKDNDMTTRARESFPDFSVTLDYTLPTTEKITNKPSETVETTTNKPPETVETTTNKTSETDECLNMSGKNCVCIGRQNANFSNITSTYRTIEADTTLESALSLTTAVSLVMNIVMGIVIYWVVTKNRRLIRQKTRPALEVDILNRGPFPMTDPHPESIVVEGLTRQISTGFEREANNNNDTEETAYSDIDQIQNEIAKSSSCSDGAGDTQTLTGPQVVSDAVAPPAPIVSNIKSTYNHLRINNGLITHVDTVYGDNSAN